MYDGIMIKKYQVNLCLEHTHLLPTYIAVIVIPAMIQAQV